MLNEGFDPNAIGWKDRFIDVVLYSICLIFKYKHLKYM
jgi:hypothetical protein